MTDKPIFSAIAITLFPPMFPGVLGYSIAGKALDAGIWSLQTLDLRDFAEDKHKTVDDSPYGGGAGMVMKPDVLGKAIEKAKEILPDAELIYMSPRGEVMTQGLVQKMVMRHSCPPPNPEHSLVSSPQAGGGIIVICGRFEGIDQRVIDYYNIREISLGDFVLSGGEVAALSLLDAIVRLLPGVMGKSESHQNDSFSPVIRGQQPESALSHSSCDFQQKITEETQNNPLLLEYPHYTRPPIWNGLSVPDMLLSGDHKKIDQWRLEQSLSITKARRPDLLNKLKKE